MPRRIALSPFGIWLQTKVAPIIYGRREPYITQDERKLDQHQFRPLGRGLSAPRSAFYNAVVTRVIPDTWTWAAKNRSPPAGRLWPDGPSVRRAFRAIRPALQGQIGPASILTSAGSILLPPHPLAKRRNMPYVVPPVPRVERHVLVQTHGSQLRMPEFAREIARL